MNILRAIALTAGFALLTPSAHAIEFGYSVGSDDHLYQIDLATGAATNLGPLGLAQVEGMTFHGINTLLGIGGAVDPQNPSQQALWNLTTPPGSAIGDTAVTSDDDSGLASHNGQLFAVQGNAFFGSQILELNPLTGGTIDSAFITAGQNDVYVDSLAIDSQGHAFAVDASLGGPTGVLYSIDLAGTLGAASVVGDLEIANLVAQSGLDFNSNDVLYMLLSDGRLFTVNTGNGDATLIDIVRHNGNDLEFQGGFAIGNIDATSAAVIPEPATASLALLAGCFAMVRRR